MREVQSIRSLLDAQAVDSVALAIAGVGSSDQSVGDTALTLAFAALSDRVEILTASMSAASGAGLADAAHASDASVTVDADAMAGVAPLREALIVLERQRVIHCENIANASVPGYKRRRLVSMSTRHEQSERGWQDPAGVEFCMAAGVLESTGGELDFGIEGVGFFKVMMPSGEMRFTRNGTLHRILSGTLVTAVGYWLTDQVLVPPGTLGSAISNDGQVFGVRDQNSLTQIGTIRLGESRKLSCRSTDCAWGRTGRLGGPAHSTAEVVSERAGPCGATHAPSEGTGWRSHVECAEGRAADRMQCAEQDDER